MSTSPAYRTFHHPIGGSNVIMSDGSKIEFGKNGLVVLNTETQASEIAALEALAKTRNVQITEVVETAAGEVTLSSKPVDPALNAAVADAAANTALDTNDKVAEFRNSLQQHAIAGANADAKANLPQ